MNPEEYIPIKVDIPYLKNYFEFQVITKGGKPWVDWSINRKHYDQVKDLLSEYGIDDQQCIDNFCWLEMIFWGQTKWSKEPKREKEEEARQKYMNDLSKFGAFVEEYNITGIQLQGYNKQKGAGSITLKNSLFIDETMEALSKMVWKANHFKESGTFKSEKKGPGSEIKLPKKIFRDHFFNLLNFLNAFPELNDLTKTNENYFAGRFFSIAGIIGPKPYTTAYKNKTERYYLIKTMQGYR